MLFRSTRTNSDAFQGGTNIVMLVSKRPVIHPSVSPYIHSRRIVLLPHPLHAHVSLSFLPHVRPQLPLPLDLAFNVICTLLSILRIDVHLIQYYPPDDWSWSRSRGNLSVTASEALLLTPHKLAYKRDQEITRLRRGAATPSPHHLSRRQPP